MRTATVVLAGRPQPPSRVGGFWILPPHWGAHFENSASLANRYPRRFATFEEALAQFQEGSRTVLLRFCSKVRNLLFGSPKSTLRRLPSRRRELRPLGRLRSASVHSSRFPDRRQNSEAGLTPAKEAQGARRRRTAERPDRCR